MNWSKSPPFWYGLEVWIACGFLPLIQTGNFNGCFKLMRMISNWGLAASNGRSTPLFLTAETLSTNPIRDALIRCSMLFTSVSLFTWRRWCRFCFLGCVPIQESNHYSDIVTSAAAERLFAHCLSKEQWMGHDWTRTRIAERSQKEVKLKVGWSRRKTVIVLQHTSNTCTSVPL